MAVSNKRAVKTDSQDIFHVILMFLLAIILFYPPYYRGLFFQTEQQWHVLFAGTLAIMVYAWRVGQGKIAFLKKPLDYLVFGLIVCYIISFFGAAAPRLALAEIVKYIIYFLVFWMTSRIVTSTKDVNLILHAFLLSATGVALAGIMTATEVININDGFVGGRIFSTMQYPNSLASYLAGTSFIALFLWSKQEGYLKHLYTICMYTILMVFLSASSRGAMIFYPAVYILYLIFLNKEFRLKNTVHTVVVIIGGVVGNYKLISSALEKNYSQTWMWFYLGLAVTLLLDVAIDYGVKNYRQYAKQALIVVLFVVLGGLSFGIFKAVNSPEYAKYMPSHIITAIKNINFQDRDVQERIVFWKDSQKIVHEHPWFGFGGGVFEESFRYYQSYFYSSTQVHSHDFQLWAESGYVGFAVWLGVFLTFLWTFLVLWRKAEGNNRQMLTAMMACAVMLWIHAWMDFDFSLSSIPIVYFSMLGLTRGIERVEQKEDNIWAQKDVNMWGWWFVGAFVLVSVMLAFVDIRFILAEKSARQAYDVYSSGDQKGAIPYYQKAVAYDPWKIEYLTDLAKMQVNNEQAEQGLANMQKAMNMNKYNAQIFSDASNMLWSAGKYDEAVAAMNKSRELFRFNNGVYEADSRINVMAGLVKMQQNDLKTAESFFESAAQTPALIAKEMNGMSEKYLSMWGTQAVPILTYTPMMKLNVGVAKHFLGDDVTAEKLFTEAYAVPETKGESAMWLAVLKIRAGNKIESDKYLNEAQKSNAQIVNDFKSLSQIPPLK